jgi:hypothetical protein
MAEDSRKTGALTAGRPAVIGALVTAAAAWWSLGVLEHSRGGSEFNSGGTATGCTSCEAGTLPSVDHPLFSRQATACKIWLEELRTRDPNGDDWAVVDRMLDLPLGEEKRYVAIWCNERLAGMCWQHPDSPEVCTMAHEFLSRASQHGDGVVAARAVELVTALKARQS